MNVVNITRAAIGRWPWYYSGPLHMGPVDRAGPVSEISPYL